MLYWQTWIVSSCNSVILLGLMSSKTCAQCISFSFTDDGDPDIASASSGDNTIAVFKNIDSGIFCEVKESRANLLFSRSYRSRRMTKRS